MKRIVSALMASVMLAAMTGETLATSCLNLWVARNTIYDDNGYCFSTELGQDYFDNDDCWTKKPKFSRKEQAAINAIVAEEKRRHCKVN